MPTRPGILTTPAVPVTLAGGENLAGFVQYRDFIASEGMAIIQPDLGKWYFPYWLGGGIGLAASMHLKTAVGGRGHVDVDSNPIRLRELLAVPNFPLNDDWVELPNEPGLGVVPDRLACKDFAVEV